MEQDAIIELDPKITATPIAVDAADASSAWLEENEPLQKSTRVLLLKPYQKGANVSYSPPLGLLCLSASLKEAFGDKVTVKVIDMYVDHDGPEQVNVFLEAFKPDIVGLSTLNNEADASSKIASVVKQYDDSIVTVIGGPYSHKRGLEILSNTQFDWSLNGPGDRAFPQAIRRVINKQDLGTDIPGLTYKRADGSVFTTDTQDFIEDLDSLPLPDWSEIQFDEYSKRLSMMNVQKGKRYGLLFTSRGCPYLCNYCHDVFGKRFKFQSAERVLQEIEHLYENYGVTEFQIVDDIFNLHKPRLKKVMHEVRRRWGGEICFCFPNGVRADIMDEEVLDDLKYGGTYAMAIAIETATPRLQDMVQKHLDIDRAKWVIEQADNRGIFTTGFFMLGFPTETKEELDATVNFALTSKLTIAYFFNVLPQPATPLYELAAKENLEQLTATIEESEKGKLQYNTSDGKCWYERAYNFPLQRYLGRTNLRFYLAPSRIWRILKRTPIKSVYRGGMYFLRYNVRLVTALLKNA